MTFYIGILGCFKNQSADSPHNQYNEFATQVHFFLRGSHGVASCKRVQVKLCFMSAKSDNNVGDPGVFGPGLIRL